MTIEDVQQKLIEKSRTAPATGTLDPPKSDEVNYFKMPTPELQQKYNDVEAWMKSHIGDPRYYIAEVRLRQMNKILASRIKI